MWFWWWQNTTSKSYTMECPLFHSVSLPLPTTMSCSRPLFFFFFFFFFSISSYSPSYSLTSSTYIVYLAFAVAACFNSSNNNCDRHLIIGRSWGLILRRMGSNPLGRINFYRNVERTPGAIPLWMILMDSLILFVGSFHANELEIESNLD